MAATVPVLVAIADAQQAEYVAEALREQGNQVIIAKNLMEVDTAMAQVRAAVVDTDFSGGAVADWLSLWPVPAVLVADPDCDPAKLAALCGDESSAFILRDAYGRWIDFIPQLARKAIAVRESIDRQNSTIIRAESSYMNLLRVMPDIVYVLDGDGYFAYLNDTISELGWKPSELLGKHFAEIVHPDDLPEVGRSLVLNRFHGVSTGPAQAPKLFDERRSGERMTRGLVVRLRHKNLDEWAHTKVDAWGEVASLGVNLPEFQGKGLGTVGIIRDISERRLAEKKLKSELEAKNVLIKEIHHRVKNNLQVVSSILSLESSCVSDEEAKTVFTDCQTQVHSMSLVHEQIYRGSSLEEVDAAAYLTRLAEYLDSVHEGSYKGIELKVKAEASNLALDKAIPLSIVVTELVSNAYKYAFPEGRAGAIRVSLEREGDYYELRVEDDGLSHEAGAGKGAKAREGLGLELVGALAQQLGGKLERSCDQGTRVCLRFPCALSS
jgi:PAS domain S-box-containing protein